MIPRLLLSSLLAFSGALAQQQLRLVALPAGTTYEPGQPIDFGTVQTTAPKSLTFKLNNGGPDDAVLTRLSAGAVFQAAWAGGNPVGLVVPVGQALQFTITYGPLTAGPALGQLWVQIATPASSPSPTLQPQAEYDLVGTGAGPTITPAATPTPTPAPTPTPTPAPVWPKASIVAEPALANCQQSSIKIQFGSALPAAHYGLLSVDFTPSGAARGDQFSVFLAPDGGTLGGVPASLSFSLTPGETVARFEGSPKVDFSLGAAAGTLTFQATINGGPQDGTLLASQAFTILPAPVGIDRVLLEPAVSGSANGVVVTAMGFDNTRTASSVSFTFYDTANHRIGQPISVDATAQFQSYFPSAATGLFGVKQAFSVTGDVSAIGSVVVSIANSQGTSTPETGTVSQ